MKQTKETKKVQKLFTTNAHKNKYSALMLFVVVVLSA
jgi:hypothetical protein